MRMMSRHSLRIAAMALMVITLAGCGRTEIYKYKLTLAVNTPNGVKRGSSVAEVEFYEVSIPARGTMHKLRGEALYLDLGPGARPLIALLTSQLHPKPERIESWTRDAGPETRLMCRLYGIAPSIHYQDDIPRLAQMYGPRQLAPTDLPDLVTFADINDPKSVIEVNPGDLQTLGPDITWNEITLESTDEPLTTGIVQKLPWIPAYFEKNLRLDGAPDHSKRNLANTLSSFDFNQTDDLRRSH